ncbi:MAG TPA: cell division ATPase MinD [Methanocella sp.]|uniref:cell division ATPase MinD n=1 Tax=Methanocella sp. TaxID=2052833 RepID=UPI002BB5B421|nr:cell division ATPase MinD [Methanocella sp.]HTY90968.1 cell division ATPase MinD [Methanocella sp.]
MTRVYTVASGKGGTGKTMTVVNLGTALALLGKKTVILDADIGMANLGLVLGLERTNITLHEVLAGEAEVSQAVYELPTGLKVVPSGISLRGFQGADPDRLQFVMSELVKDADYVIIDAPAGINKDGVIPLAIADEVLLVVNPELSSMLDAAKVEAVIDIVGGTLGGIVLNRVPPYRASQTVQSIGQVMNAPVLAVIPEDSNVRTATAFKTPVVIRYPESPASRGYKALAARLSGEKFDQAQQQNMPPAHPLLSPKKESFVERLTRSVFGDI